MLCPKCGFISFDHLADCVNCHNDLSMIAGELHGTAANVAGLFFLGSLIKDSATGTEGAALEAEGVTLGAEGLAQDEIEIAGDDTLIIEAEDLGPLEEPEEAAAEEPPLVEFDFFETMNQDGTEVGLSLGEEVATAARPVEAVSSEELPAMPEVEAPLVTMDDKEMAEPPPMAAEVDDVEDDALPATLEIDTQTLDLDAGDQEGLLGMDSPEEESQSGQLTIDLDSIDLSDLVHGGQGAATDQSDADTTDGGGLGPDDTMDLSLFSGEGFAPLVADAVRPVAEGELNPVDLSLMDDALVELTVEPSRKEEAVSASGGADILELSMEESDQ
jgi:hypothetical protein